MTKKPPPKERPGDQAFFACPGRAGYFFAPKHDKINLQRKWIEVLNVEFFDRYLMNLVK